MFRTSLVSLLSVVMMAYSASAMAYVGPALGLGIIGTVVTVILVSLLSLFAFIFVPIRNLFKKSGQKNADKDADS